MFIPLLKAIIKSYLSEALVYLASGLRMLALFIVAVIVSAMMSCVSAFAGIFYAIYQYKITGSIVFDGLLIFCSIVFVISLLMFLKLMCKRCWIRTLSIDALEK
jgi:hypothetical protein